MHTVTQHVCGTLVQERLFLSVSNYLFTVLFTLEMMVKVGRLIIPMFY